MPKEIQMIPKSKHKKHRPKNNPKPTADDVCEYPGCNRNFAELHEVFFGPLRQLSIKHKLQKRLCSDHHRGSLGPHQCQEHNLELKREAQTAFEQTHSRNEFTAIFGRNYLDI